MTDARPSLIRQTLQQEVSRYWRVTIHIDRGVPAAHLEPDRDVPVHLCNTLDDDCWCRPTRLRNVEADVIVHGVARRAPVWVHTASDGRTLERNQIAVLLQRMKHG